MDLRTNFQRQANKHSSINRMKPAKVVADDMMVSGDLIMSISGQVSDTGLTGRCSGRLDAPL